MTDFANLELGRAFTDKIWKLHDIMNRNFNLSVLVDESIATKSNIMSKYTSCTKIKPSNKSDKYSNLNYSVNNNHVMNGDYDEYGQLNVTQNFGEA